MQLENWKGQRFQVLEKLDVKDCWKLTWFFSKALKTSKAKSTEKTIDKVEI